MIARTPNFFLIGAVKSGSTSLYYYLNEHPDIYMSPIKEPHYFSHTDMDFSEFRPKIKERISFFDQRKYLQSSMKKLVHRAYLTSWVDYVQLFKNVKNETAIGEASTSYLWSASAAKEIKDKIPEAKIIFILRNPIERTFSHYLMDLKNGLTSRDFLQALTEDNLVETPTWGKNSMYLETGMYAKQVKRYMELFPETQYKFILFDDFVSQPMSVIKEVYRFLGVDDSFVPNFTKKHNSAILFKNNLVGKIYNHKLVRKFIVDKISEKIKDPLKKIFFKTSHLPTIKVNEKLLLIDTFEKELKVLEKIIHKDLSHWLK